MKTWLWPLLLVGQLAASCAWAQNDRASVVVIAHRGNREAAHENTLEAIRNAIAIKADFVELDVRRTKDGHHILMHDPTVKRMTGVNAKVNKLTLQEIQALKISDAARPAIPNSHIPTIEEALDEIGSSIGLYLDFKDGDPQYLATELRRRQQVKTTVVYLATGKIEAWKAAEPSMRFIVRVPRRKRSVKRLNSFLDRNPGIHLAGQVTDYSRKLIETAHSRGSQVWPDIQNPGESADQWSKAIDLGVDGLQTDHPSQLISYLSSRVNSRGKN